MPTITISDIANWVANTRLKRPDLIDDVVEEAVNFYYVLCEAIPFEGLQVTSAELPMTSGTASYSLASLDPTLSGIMSISVSFGSNSFVRLRRSHVRAYDAMRATPTGRPYSYARWANAIELNPAPNSSSYTYRIRYWSQPTISLVKGDTVVLYSTAWAELHRWETLYRALCILNRHDEAAALVAPSYAQKMPKGMSSHKTRMDEMGIIPRLWNNLLKRNSERENVDEDFSINPLVRPYTA